MVFDIIINIISTLQQKKMYIHFLLLKIAYLMAETNFEWTIALLSPRSHHAMLHSKTILSSQTGASKLFCIGYSLFWSRCRTWCNCFSIFPIFYFSNRLLPIRDKSRFRLMSSRSRIKPKRHIIFSQNMISFVFLQSRIVDPMDGGPRLLAVVAGQGLHLCKQNIINPSHKSSFLLHTNHLSIYFYLKLSCLATVSTFQEKPVQLICTFKK